MPANAKRKAATKKKIAKNFNDALRGIGLIVIGLLAMGFVYTLIAMIVYPFTN